MPLDTLLYRTIKRVIPLDVTYVFLRQAEPASQSGVEETPADKTNTTGNISCRQLNLEDLRGLATNPEFSIDAQFLDDCAKGPIRVVGVVIRDEIEGMCCFANGQVPAHLNTGGKTFLGAGMVLPANCAYLFKVLVKQEHRGKRLTSKMIQFALSQHDVAKGKTLITTSDITNTAFRNAAERLGFQVIDRVSEAVLFGHHLFRLPAPIVTPQASDVNADSKTIVFKKPKSA